MNDRDASRETHAAAHELAKPLRKRRKWVSYASVITGLIVILLLIFAINSEPLVRWFQRGPQGAGQEHGLGQAGRGPMTWHEALGTVLISVLIMALLFSHLALLIVAANSLNKAQVPAIRALAACPQCERSVQLEWRACPYCGLALDKALNHPSIPPGPSSRIS